VLRPRLWHTSTKRIRRNHVHHHQPTPRNPGDPYIPAEGVNIDALLNGGLISTDSVKKSSKVKSEPKEQ
jgi:hypothetical protein